MLIDNLSFNDDFLLGTQTESIPIVYNTPIVYDTPLVIIHTKGLYMDKDQLLKSKEIFSKSIINKVGLILTQIFQLQ